MLFRDATAPLSTRLTRDGYLVADVRMARVGLYEYGGHELGRSELGQVSVLRPIAEVFNTRAMASFAHVPVTFGHPPAGIGAASWRKDAVGHVGDEIVRDGEYVRATIIIQDGEAIERIRAGSAELSCGYLCKLEWETGVTRDQRGYQAVQTRIVGNHVAIVDRGRAGSACRIGEAV